MLVLKVLIIAVFAQELLVLGVLEILIKTFYWYDQVYQMVKVLKVLIGVLILRLLILEIFIPRILMSIKVLLPGIYFLLKVLVLKVHLLEIFALKVIMLEVLVLLSTQ